MSFTHIISIVFITAFSSIPEALKYDENDRLVFTKVVDVEQSKSELISAAKELDHLKRIDSASFFKQGRLKLYKKHLAKSPHGELHFSLQLDFKENKYRYIFRDFKFIPLIRNRYGRFEAETKSAVSLETLLQEPDRTWKKHKNTIEKELAEISQEINKTLIESKEVENLDKVSISDNW